MIVDRKKKEKKNAKEREGENVCIIFNAFV